MSPRARVLSRGFTIAVGLGYAVAVGVLVQRAFTGADFLRSFRWPLYSGEAAILALIALMFIAGATIHVTGIAAGCATVLMLLLAKFDSESTLAPLVGITTGVLGFVYVKAGLGSIRMLPITRLAMLLASLVLAAFSIARMEEPTIQMDWQRIRTAAGGVELRRFVGEGKCKLKPPVAKDIAEIDSGCSESIPAKRAGYVIGYSAASAVLALGALIRAPQVRRLSDGTPVPPWI